MTIRQNAKQIQTHRIKSKWQKLREKENKINATGKKSNALVGLTKPFESSLSDMQSLHLKSYKYTLHYRLAHEEKQIIRFVYSNLMGPRTANEWIKCPMSIILDFILLAFY